VGKETQKGFISWIILIIVALALLKYFFDWSIFDAAASEQGRGTISYIRDVLNTIWSYISTPVIFIWSQIIWPILEFTWQAFQALLAAGREASAR
jgi:hypothetical protein